MLDNDSQEFSSGNVKGFDVPQVIKITQCRRSVFVGTRDLWKTFFTCSETAT